MRELVFTTQGSCSFDTVQQASAIHCWYWSLSEYLRYLSQNSPWLAWKPGLDWVWYCVKRSRLWWMSWSQRTLATEYRRRSTKKAFICRSFASCSHSPARQAEVNTTLGRHLIVLRLYCPIMSLNSSLFIQSRKGNLEAAQHMSNVRKGIQSEVEKPYGPGFPVNKQFHVKSEKAQLQSSIR